jgi:hypothetical protein
MKLKEMDETLALAEVDNAVTKKMQHGVLLLYVASHVYA